MTRETTPKVAIVLGAGGFIGNHLVNRLKLEGYYVCGADLKKPEYQEKSNADIFYSNLDLRTQTYIDSVFYEVHRKYSKIDEVYQLAADMGGAGYIFTGEHDADVMYNSALINLNVANLCVKYKVGKVFYSSSACMYPSHNQEDPNNPNCKEDSAYPANPDSEYGWEKLFSERLYLSYQRNYGIDVRIARFHNIFGPLGTWEGGKEKAPAAICRKVIQSDGSIEVWGDGEQTRSFLYIDECIEGVRRLMQSDFTGPVNIGSDEMVTINQLVEIAQSFEHKELQVNHIPGPTGVRGRNSDNTLIYEKLNWKPSAKLVDGLRDTYFWIKQQVEKKTIESTISYVQ